MIFNIATIASVISLLGQIQQYGPAIKNAIDIATSNDDLVTKLKHAAGSLAPVLEQVGSQLFPSAAPALHLIGGAVALLDLNGVKFVQNALNQLGQTPPLTVDGDYGNLTKAAVSAYQKKRGLTVDGLVGQITRAALEADIAARAKAKAA